MTTGPGAIQAGTCKAHIPCAFTVRLSLTCTCQQSTCCHAHNYMCTGHAWNAPAISVPDFQCTTLAMTVLLHRLACNGWAPCRLQSTITQLEKEATAREAALAQRADETAHLNQASRDAHTQINQYIMDLQVWRCVTVGCIHGSLRWSHSLACLEIFFMVCNM